MGLSLIHIYMQERGVEFYADKLCLSPKYLSAVSKSICGYTVQELVFKAIIRKSISLLKNTQKDIQEISNAFGFPNASYFGTFFKKQVDVYKRQVIRLMKTTRHTGIRVSVAIMQRNCVAIKR